LISLLNRISRGIEDAWTAGFIQLFVLVLLAYGVVNNVVSTRNAAADIIQGEQQYIREHHTNLTADELPPFDLRAELWSNAVPIIIMVFIIAYEVRRRSKVRAARRLEEKSQAP
jgi:mannose/cellobiose epimerase-like protein (N-acyl-D-glucosamine 2-epimerase family)